MCGGRFHYTGTGGAEGPVQFPCVSEPRTDAFMYGQAHPVALTTLNSLDATSGLEAKQHGFCTDTRTAKYL